MTIENTTNKTWRVINGNSAEVLKQYPDNHFDSVVTDPPYGINFLGKDWDSNTGEEEVYRQCLRVLKPGGHLLAFSAARTYHHLAMAVERSGFEIRDQIMWVYGSGFPKSQDIGRALDKRGISNDYHGYGTNLKPSHEPIVMARKPIKTSIIDNVQEWGTGALNIDACRVAADKTDVFDGGAKASSGVFVQGYEHDGFVEGSPLGRFPANFIHDGSAEVVELFPLAGNGNNKQPYSYAGKEYNNKSNSMFNGDKPQSPSNYNDTGSAARFFYCAKVSKTERNIGCDDVNLADFTNKGNGIDRVCETCGVPQLKPHLCNCEVKSWVRPQKTGNHHPTVKPVALMKYLIQLVTPPNGHVLDPFNGSGSTGMAAVELNMNYTGIELDPNYVAIANKRIQAWQDKCSPEPKQVTNPWAELEQAGVITIE